MHHGIFNPVIHVAKFMFAKIQLDLANLNSLGYFDFLYFELNLTISYGKLNLTNSSCFEDPPTKVYCFRPNFNIPKLVHLKL